MIDTKKEQERDELHRAIWAIADELRGAVDGWDFKKLCSRNHVLSLYLREPDQLHQFWRTGSWQYRF